MVVIEDDRDVAETIRTILEDSAYTVVVLDEPDSTLSDAAHALVITDLTTRAGYDSAAAIHQVREVRSRTGSPVLVLTAHREATTDCGLADVATAVMTKPFQVDDLIAIVERLAV